MEMMMMLLLVSAMAQLATPSPTNRPHSPHLHLNLNRIIDLAANYKNNITQDLFVEDVEPLLEKGCKNDFFCKVEDILRQHHGKEKALVKNLAIYNKHLNVNCTAVLAEVPKSDVGKPITDLMRHLESCSKLRNTKA